MWTKCRFSRKSAKNAILIGTLQRRKRHPYPWSGIYNFLQYFHSKIKNNDRLPEFRPSILQNKSDEEIKMEDLGPTINRRSKTDIKIKINSITTGGRRPTYFHFTVGYKGFLKNVTISRKCENLAKNAILIGTLQRKNLRPYPWSGILKNRRIYSKMGKKFRKRQELSPP